MKTVLINEIENGTKFTYKNVTYVLMSKTFVPRPNAKMSAIRVHLLREIGSHYKFYTMSFAGRPEVQVD
jgi:hypothetical protein